MNRLPRAIRAAAVEAVRLYNRLEISARAEVPDVPTLFVANHGFGGIVDLNLFAFAAAYDELGLDRELVVLTHQMVWTLKIEKLVEPFGARPANTRSALDAFDAGHNVLVFPGGDLDALKSWRDRNTIMFGGRSGFARLAMEAGVPIVPVVTAGAGETLFVATSGRALAKALRLDKVLRLKTFPLSVSIPWGVNLGLAGLLPYLPLPAKLTTSVLPAMSADDGESAEQLADRVHDAMQRELTALTRDRIPLVG